MYLKVVVPANGLKVNHNDFVALSLDLGNFLKGLNLDMSITFHSN